MRGSRRQFHNYFLQVQSGQDGQGVNQATEAGDSLPGGGRYKEQCIAQCEVTPLSTTMCFY